MFHSGRSAEDTYCSGSKKNPSHEKYLLTTQVIDSSGYITGNIAEGFSRFTFTGTGDFLVCQETP